MEKHFKIPFPLEDALHEAPSCWLRKGECCDQKNVSCMVLTKFAILLRLIKAVLNCIFICLVKVKWQVIQLM